MVIGRLGVYSRRQYSRLQKQGPAIQGPRETPYTWPFGVDGKQDITFIILNSILQK